jgi:hypothetical protein
MNRIKVILLGASLGGLVGLTSALLASLTTVFAGQIETALGQGLQTGLTLAPFSLLNGLVVGGLRGALGRAFATREFTVYSVLISIAIGSIRIMAGSFERYSLMPAAIYGLAIFNGVIVTPVVVQVLFRSKLDDRNRFAA